METVMIGPEPAISVNTCREMEGPAQAVTCFGHSARAPGSLLVTRGILGESARRE
jgi:hypothetical protein